MKLYLALAVFVLLFVFMIYQEIDFAKRCNANSGIYKHGRMSLCLSKDGRILETL